MLGIELDANGRLPRVYTMPLSPDEDAPASIIDMAGRWVYWLHSTEADVRVATYVLAATNDAG